MVHRPSQSPRLQKGAIQDVVRKRISIAIQNMDTAPIHTIHSFCQKILASYGFEANTGFESTMASDEGVRSFIEKICRDEWPKDSLFQTLVAQDAFNFEKAIGILTQLVNKYNPETLINLYNSGCICVKRNLSKRCKSCY